MRKIFSTARTTLAIWQQDDEAIFASLPLVASTDLGLDELAAMQAQHGCQLWAVHHEGKIVGALGFTFVKAGRGSEGPTLSFAAHLLPHVQKNGLATEAGAFALRYAFDVLGAGRVIASAHKDNTAILRVLQKLRFTGTKSRGDERNFERERPISLPGADRLFRWCVVKKDGDAEALVGRARYRFTSDARTPPGTIVELSVPMTRAIETQAATLSKILARPGGARAELFAIMKKLDLDASFPPEVWREVYAHMDGDGFLRGDLEDLSHLPFVTIDNDDSRDLDQALYFNRSAGGITFFYALADASYFAPPDSALFHEALKRGTTYYFPGQAIPMLPGALSEGLCSLNPGVMRRALVFRIEVSQDGTPSATSIFSAKIRSRQKLTYHGVEAFFDTPETSPLVDRPFAESLSLMRELGQIRIDRARRRDVVTFERSEVRVGYGDQEGMTFSIVRDDRNMCEKYNEQISLLCNIEGARFFLRSQKDPALQPIFRNHDAPPAERVAGFRRFVEKLVRTHKLDEETWLWRDQTLADYLDQLPIEEDTKRLAMAIHRQAMVINVRSEFEDIATGHYGIGAEAYARFSSPMREVVGIYTHKEALEVLGAPAHDDSALRDKVVTRANAAKALQKKIEKACNQLAIDALFAREAQVEEEQRPLRTGTIMGITPSKIYVQFDEPPIEVKVYLSETRGGPYAIDDDKTEVTRPGGDVFRVGDAVELRLGGKSVKKRRWVLDLV